MADLKVDPNNGLARAGLRGETRTIGKPELRAAGENTPQKIGGYAAVFNSPTSIRDVFMEVIAPGAFTTTIAKNDIRALFNHDPNFVLGRNVAKTLRLVEDARGLAIEIDPPDSQAVRDLVIEPLQRGDISQMSFQFHAIREQWDQSGEIPVRTLVEVELYDVSIVTFPAYDDTSVGMRSLKDWRARHVVIPSKAPLIGSRLRMRHALRERELAR